MFSFYCMFSRIIFFYRLTSVIRGLTVIFLIQANGEAALGKYAGGVAGAAGDSSLFIKDHAY